MESLWQVEKSIDLYLDKFAHRYSTFPGLICARTSNCRFWSWAVDDRKCFLKSSDDGLRKLGNHWSGDRGCPPTPSNFIETQVTEDSTARDDEIDGVDDFIKAQVIKDRLEGDNVAIGVDEPVGQEGCALGPNVDFKDFNIQHVEHVWSWGSCGK